MAEDERWHSPLKQWLESVYRDGRWLVALPVVQGAAWLADALQEMGCPPCFVLGGAMGTGRFEPSDYADWACLGQSEPDMMTSMRVAEDSFRRLPKPILEQLDRFDPDRKACVVGAFFSQGTPIAGRKYFGARQPAWLALEDKTVIDALWDAVGVPRTPSRVVAALSGALDDAAKALDMGYGTVWAADNTDGFHGGASNTFWVRDAASREVALESLRHSSRTARVMPFLEGIPCSIHGIVLPDYVVSLRPAEMVVLRRPSPGGFYYARASTFWDPPGSQREAMRAMAKRVGEYLRAQVGYRGAFTIDGIMTADGFRPTELNPRVGAAMAMTGPGIEWSLVHYAIIEGHVPPLDPCEWEHDLVAYSDANRSVRCGFLVDHVKWEESRSSWVDFSGPEATFSDEPTGAKLVAGPSATGGYISLSITGEGPVIRLGESAAPLVAKAVDLCDRELGTRIGPLTWAANLS
ncbi:MAG: hypothetical protein KC561_10505 [Myxococcales bacterium]|nr:hypothetical protein [Myxococcales bacterium]